MLPTQGPGHPSLPPVLGRGLAMPPDEGPPRTEPLLLAPCSVPAVAVAAGVQSPERAAGRKFGQKGEQRQFSF